VTRIQRLPPALANQIAAGEVVERPASVVKELVENALDAGARRIVIAIEFGGKKLVSVEDDGAGMSREDAVLAIERHATSKIRSASDLASIRTLGFRGEALPSIASVSRFRLRTRDREALAGIEVRVEGGAAPVTREVGAPHGTLVEVADLFFNLPARRKFLKADTAEAAQISRLVTQLALGYPEIGFTLRNGDRVVIDTPPAAGLEERFYQVYGDRADLVRVEKQAAGIAVRGFAAALTDQGPARGVQHVFVNRRIVRDRTIAHAIQQAYSAATIKERSPEVHLFIELDPQRVDVNVHPTKAEVRFLDQGLVHEILRRAIVDALGLTAAPELALAAATVAPGVPRETALPWNVSSWPGVGPGAGAGEGAPGFPPSRLVSTDPRSLGEGGQTGPGTQTWDARTAAAWAQAMGEPMPRRTDVGSFIRPMAPLGQFRNTFIIAVDEDGLAIIDQHVAHERILFEQFSERLTSRALESQRLLAPIVLELDAAAHQTLLGHLLPLGRLGFEIEDFGGTSLRVLAVPAVLELGRAEAALRAAAADLDGLAPGAGIEEALRQMAATMACHAAVKANDPLTREKMQYLLDELRRTAHSSVCPHGRPVVLRLTRREIEKSFERL
jgi:DNA mismatch repair protein MutL